MGLKDNACLEYLGFPLSPASPPKNISHGSPRKWMSNFTKLHLTLEIFRILPVFSQFLWILSRNFLFQWDLTIIPFYPCPGLGREYKDRYPDEWTVLEGQQHLTHSTLLNAFYLKKLVRQQRCYLLLKERGPLGHTHTIILLGWETAALAKHCCRADRQHWTLVRDYRRFLCHRR